MTCRFVCIFRYSFVQARLFFGMQNGLRSPQSLKISPLLVLEDEDCCRLAGMVGVVGGSVVFLAGRANRTSRYGKKPFAIIVRQFPAFPTRSNPVWHTFSYTTQATYVRKMVPKCRCHFCILLIPTYFLQIILTMLQFHMRLACFGTLEGDDD